MPKPTIIKPKPPKPKPQASFEEPTLFPIHKFQPLTLEERVEFRQFLATPLFQKLIRNAYCYKPTSSALPGGFAKWDQHAAEISSHRLHQIQGWEIFQAALFSQAEDKIPKTNKPVEEQYQEPGS